MSDTSDNDEFAADSKKDMAKAAKKKDYGVDDAPVYDEILSALFEKVAPGEGDEFAAVKPWLGAIKEPKTHPKANKKAPVEDFAIDWVYGYRSEEARQNCAFNSEGNAVYPTAALGVVFDYKNMKQSYFGGGKTDFGGRKQGNKSEEGHTDDVTALCVSFSRKMVASGQNGQSPAVYLWDATTAKVISQFKLPKGARLVTAIGISATDKYICASDAAEKITAHIFKIGGTKSPIASIAINMKIVHLAWSPNTEEAFATAGKDHLAICSLKDESTVTKTMGKAKGGKIESQCSAAWINDPAHKDSILTGASDGKVYHWKNGDVVKAYDNSKGAVGSICARKGEDGKEIVLVGGKDKTLTIYSFDGALKKLWNVVCDAEPRSVDLFKGQILLGLKNGSISELKYTADGKAKPKTVMTSHCDGETWGLDLCMLEDGEMRLITSGDDNRLLAYNPKTFSVLAEGIVNEKKKAKKEKGGYKGGASSMSSQPAECQSRCVAYCQQNKHLAVSDNKGIVTIREIDWAEVDAGKSGSLDKVTKTLFKDVKKAEWIETMVFSPDGKYLAVGSHDNMIYLVATKTYKKVTKLTGHSSFITSLDWSQDSSYIRSVCGAYELLFFNCSNSAKPVRDPSGASNTMDTVWTDQTCKLGWSV